MVTDDTFNKAISEGVTLIVFWSPGCPPCHMMRPAVDDLDGKYRGRIQVYRARKNDNEKMAEKYKVEAFPQFLLFKDGEEIKRLVGSTQYEVLERAILEVLNGDMVRPQLGRDNDAMHGADQR